jgi:hypothetical protein
MFSRFNFNPCAHPACVHIYHYLNDLRGAYMNGLIKQVAVLTDLSFGDLARTIGGADPLPAPVTNPIGAVGGGLAISSLPQLPANTIVGMALNALLQQNQQPSTPPPAVPPIPPAKP